MGTVYDRVKEVVEKQLGVDGEEISPTTSFAEDLKASSLDMMELVVALEEEFSDSSIKLEIPDEDTEKMQTVQDAVDYIQQVISREK